MIGWENIQFRGNLSELNSIFDFTGVLYFPGTSPAVS